MMADRRSSSTFPARKCKVDAIIVEVIADENNAFGTSSAITWALQGSDESDQGVGLTNFGSI